MIWVDRCAWLMEPQLFDSVALLSCWLKRMMMLDEPRRPHIIELERKKKWIHFDFHCSYHFALLVLDVLKVNNFQSVLLLQQDILGTIVIGRYVNCKVPLYEENFKKAPNLIWNYLVTNSKMTDYFNFFGFLKIYQVYLEMESHILYNSH